MYWFSFENIIVVVLWRMVYRDMKVEIGRYVRRILLGFYKDGGFWDKYIVVDIRSGWILVVLVGELIRFN